MFAGRPLAGQVRIEPEGVKSEALAAWVGRGTDHAAKLRPGTAARKSRRFKGAAEIAPSRARGNSPKRRCLHRGLRQRRQAPYAFSPSVESRYRWGVSASDSPESR